MRCDAVSIATALKNELLRLKLIITKLIGISTNNASVEKEMFPLGSNGLIRELHDH